jgi:hypothetical protein
MLKTLDFIHRLQKENEELKSPKFASWKLKFFNLKEEFDKELAEHEEFTKKAKAEIERLTEENTKVISFNDALYREKQQAVKDTAKEILDMFDDRNYISESDLKKAIAERYCVEVE